MQPKDRGVPPLKLFRTLALNLPLGAGMGVLGRYMLGRNTDVAAGFDLRTRELVIDRVTARCGCEYEWGVHVAAYGEAAGLTAEQIYSLVHGSASDDCWSETDGAVLAFVDELHDGGDVTDPTWSAMSSRFSDEILLELLVLAGWYHAISYVANGARTELEDWAPRFPTARA
jgi:alkylhydroperoxidase family enzyme